MLLKTTVTFALVGITMAAKASVSGELMDPLLSADACGTTQVPQEVLVRRVGKVVKQAFQILEMREEDINNSLYDPDNTLFFNLKLAACETTPKAIRDSWLHAVKTYFQSSGKNVEVVAQLLAPIYARANEVEREKLRAHLSGPPDLLGKMNMVMQEKICKRNPTKVSSSLLDWKFLEKLVPEAPGASPPSSKQKKNGGKKQ